MSVINDFVQLNRLALEVEDTISAIQVGYLKRNNEYSYSEVDNLADKYGAIFKKIYKKKNSVVNEFVNRFNSKRKNSFDELNAPSRDEVLALASAKTGTYILNNFNQYIPVDERSMNNIYNKLFPIMKNLEPSDIMSLYRQFKEKIKGVEGIDTEMTPAFLQQIFVSYIISRLSHNPMNKFSRTRMLWTYEEVCKSLLEEPVLRVQNQENKKSR